MVSVLQKTRLFLLLALISAFLSACVSINTVPNAGGQNAQQQQPNDDEIIRESKVSLEDAANYNMSLGAQYVSKGNLNKGIEKLQKAITQDPSLALAYSYLGFAYEKLGDAYKADRNYLKALTLEADNPVSANNYGTFLCRQNKWQASLTYFERAATNRQYQTPEAAYANAGICARKIPDNKKAMEYFQRVLVVDPRSQEALWNLADLSILENDLAGAQDYYQAFNKVSPDKTLTADKLLLAYRIAKASDDLGTARIYANQLKEKFPNSEQAAQLMD